ncbi:ABC transporter permease ['Paenibacillus yunnanensis' Narsing Rao et al. 2020]|uniref:ABC transporter permease n=1 Tax=Paenibacillus tengchongensis TaxID=2608684 RepID=UPI00124E29E2|nr:ABC transporter permease [Paenibacillus tengchongensis]
MRVFRVMFGMEWKLAVRGMDMVIFAVAMPVAVMIVLGMIYGDRPAYAGASYSFVEQSFGAVTAVAIAASGLMGLPLVVADYRSRKILKRFKVTPVSPVLILLVQMLVNLLMSLIALVLVYIVGAVCFGLRVEGSWVLFMGAFLLVAASVYSIGMLVGAVSPNIKISNLLCCVLYFPMLLFSGATIPYEVMPGALRRAADVLPLAQGIKLLKTASLGLPADHMLLPLAVTAGIAAVCGSIAIRFFRWE